MKLGDEIHSKHHRLTCYFDSQPPMTKQQKGGVRLSSTVNIKDNPASRRPVRQSRGSSAMIAISSARRFSKTVGALAQAPE